MWRITLGSPSSTLGASPRFSSPDFLWTPRPEWKLGDRVAVAHGEVFRQDAVYDRYVDWGAVQEITESGLLVLGPTFVLAQFGGGWTTTEFPRRDTYETLWGPIYEDTGERAHEWAPWRRIKLY